MKKPHVPIAFKLLLLVVLLLQNSFYTLFRRFALGVKKSQVSYNEILLMAEVFKVLFSSFKIWADSDRKEAFLPWMRFVILNSTKMFGLAMIYLTMNMLSFVSLARIDASTFSICAQMKVLSTAAFSFIVLGRRFSLLQVLALCHLVIGCIMVSYNAHLNSINSSPDVVVQSNITNGASLLAQESTVDPAHMGQELIGMIAVLAEVLMSGFASIYFEKVIKSAGTAVGSPLSLGIWERNVQLAFHSSYIYVGMIAYNGGGELGYFRGWNWMTWVLVFFAGAGGLLVALTVKYTDAVMKTVATAGAIVVATVLGWLWLDGPLDTNMMLGVGVVVLAIQAYSFSPKIEAPKIDTSKISYKLAGHVDEEEADIESKVRHSLLDDQEEK